MPGSILVVAAHPDDEVLGCGSTIARLAQEGHHVYIAVLGEGITSRYSQPHEADPSALESLRTQAHQAAEILGAKELFMHSLPDNRFDTVPLLDVVKIIEDLVGKLSPEVVYTHHNSDLNIDHVTVHRAVLTATRPVPGQPVRDVYAFEIASSTEWAFHSFEPAFKPNVFMDCSATIDTKICALEKYTGEVRAFPHPRSPEALRATARRWGSVVGVEYAEAFELIRSVR